MKGVALATSSACGRAVASIVAWCERADGRLARYARFVPAFVVNVVLLVVGRVALALHELRSRDV